MIPGRQNIDDRTETGAAPPPCSYEEDDGLYWSGKMLPALLTLCATCVASCQTEPPERTDECTSPEQAARSMYALVSPADDEGLTFQPDRFGEGMSGFIISRGEQELARIVIDDETCRVRFYSNIYIK